MNRPLTEVLRAPLITEKGTLLRETENLYLFEVATSANKIQIKKAVETLFKVKVQSVRTVTVHGKVKRLGRKVGRRPDWKKAYVKLKPGEKPIEFFEGT